jgi:predicted glycosyltransferase
MKIFIDTGHPAHIHFFYPIAKELERAGYKIFFFIREKECSKTLASSYNINHFSKGPGSYFLILKPFYFIRSVGLMLIKSIRAKPDVLLSIASPYAGVVSLFLNKPHITFNDTESGTIMRWLLKKLSSTIITPSCLKNSYNRKEIRIDTYKGLSYLNPNSFTQTSNFKQKIGFAPPKKYILIRLVKHGAMHDFLSSKWNKKSKFQFVDQLAKRYNVVISSETALPKELEKYEYELPEISFHKTIANASLVVGESASVAAESALLGIPAIFISHNTRGYITEIENQYNLIYHLKPTEKGLRNAYGLIDSIFIEDNHQKYQNMGQTLVNEKINIKKFLTWFIKSYPDSHYTMKNNPAYQYNFK